MGISIVTQISAAGALLLGWAFNPSASGAELRGRVIDGATGQPLAARLYIRDAQGGWHFADTMDASGRAVVYDKAANSVSVEKHTALSAHPFRAEVPVGKVTLVVEHGKEFLPAEQTIDVSADGTDVTMSMRRWIDMPQRGWYSGDSHVHRSPTELLTVSLAEDVNVTLPMGYWTTEDNVPPSASTRNIPGSHLPQPQLSDATHVVYSRNTEYEIFQTAGRRHTLGAFLLLNHKSVFDMTAMPVRRVAERVRAEGGWIDLEKHNWEWSAAIAALMRPDFYEIANNHMWRSNYAYTDWAIPAPPWMQIGSGRQDERAWTLYSMQNYYAFLNCGLWMMPTAGTAHGVHPVPLGFSRVYVHMPEGFSYANWVRRWHEGRSFVTTGPMLFVSFGGEEPGTQKLAEPQMPAEVMVTGVVRSEHPSEKAEIIRNGEVVASIQLDSHADAEGGYSTDFSVPIKLGEAAWLAVRVWEPRADGRFRFAHTAPALFHTRENNVRPRRQEAEWLVQRVEDELQRSAPLLTPQAVQEYEWARDFYRGLLTTARE